MLHPALRALPLSRRRFENPVCPSAAVGLLVLYLGGKLRNRNAVVCISEGPRRAQGPGCPCCGGGGVRAHAGICPPLTEAPGEETRIVPSSSESC